jgi:hypothetical protein
MLSTAFVPAGVVFASPVAFPVFVVPAERPQAETSSNSTAPNANDARQLWPRITVFLPL